MCGQTQIKPLTVIEEPAAHWVEPIGSVWACPDTTGLCWSCHRVNVGVNDVCLPRDLFSIVPSFISNSKTENAKLQEFLDGWMDGWTVLTWYKIKSHEAGRQWTLYTSSSMSVYLWFLIFSVLYSWLDVEEISCCGLWCEMWKCCLKWKTGAGYIKQPLAWLPSNTSHCYYNSVGGWKVEEGRAWNALIF